MTDSDEVDDADGEGDDCVVDLDDDRLAPLLVLRRIAAALSMLLILPLQWNLWSSRLERLKSDEAKHPIRSALLLQRLLPGLNPSIPVPAASFTCPDSLILVLLVPFVSSFPLSPSWPQRYPRSPRSCKTRNKTS
jgi:hypothetical protein